MRPKRTGLGRVTSCQKKDRFVGVDRLGGPGGFPPLQEGGRNLILLAAGLWI